MVINMQVKRSNGNKVLLTFYHRHQFRYDIASSKPIKYTESVYEYIIFAAVFELSSPIAVQSAHPRARAHAPRAPRDVLLVLLMRLCSSSFCCRSSCSIYPLVVVD